MQCPEVRESLARGEIPTGADQHLLVCESCAALVVRRLAEQDAASLKLEPLLAAVEAQIAREYGVAAWLRSQATSIRWLLAAAASLSLVLMAAGLAGRSDLGSLPLASQIPLLLYVLGSLILAAELLRPMHERQRPRLSRALGLLAFFMPALIAVWLALTPHTALVAPRSDCLPLGLLVGAPLLLLLRGLDRGARVSASPALLAISTAALAGNLALVLCCPSNSPAHILRTHAPVGLALALGYCAARRLIRVVAAA